MFKRKVTIARCVILLGCPYSLREWLNIDKILRSQKLKVVCLIHARRQMYF